MDERVQNIITALDELTEDSSVPKNIRAKLTTMAQDLKAGNDMSMVISKSLSDLDEISDSANIQAYTRQQIWNLSSLLEMLQVI